MSNSEPPAGSVPPDDWTPPSEFASPPPSDLPPPPPSYAGAGYGAAPTAGVPRPGELLDRFVARLLDLILVGIVGSIISAILAAISGSYFLATFVDSIVLTAIYLGYFTYLESSRGQTVGKMVMKLRVLGPDGRSNPTPAQALKRNIWLGATILGILSTFGEVIGGLVEIVAIIVCAVNISRNVPDRRTWFDTFAGGTEVMKIG